MTRTPTFSLPSIVLTLYTILFHTTLAAAAAAHGDDDVDDTDKAGILTGVKVAMGVLLVVFILVIFAMCGVGRKTPAPTRSVLPTTSPAAAARPTAHTTKSLRSLFGARAKHQAGPRDVALGPRLSADSLSGNTLVDVPWRGSTDTLAPPPPAYMPPVHAPSSVVRATGS